MKPDGVKRRKNGKEEKSVAKSLALRFFSWALRHIRRVSERLYGRLIRFNMEILGDHGLLVWPTEDFRPDDESNGEVLAAVLKTQEIAEENGYVIFPSRAFMDVRTRRYRQRRDGSLAKIELTEPDPSEVNSGSAEIEMDRIRLMNRALATLRAQGFLVYRSDDDYHCCPKIYGASFGKLIDIREIQPFADHAAGVINSGRTLLYYDRLFILYQSVINALRLEGESPNMAEVGVHKGGSTHFIASIARYMSDRPPAIYSFDTFAGHPDDIRPELDGRHAPGSFDDTSYEDVAQYLSEFNNVVLLKGRFQDNCHIISGKRFSFVHIDVDIYSATRDCLNFFADAVVSGGIIVVDDYGFLTCVGCKVAVDEFLKQRTGFTHISLDTGQCLLIRNQ